MLVTQTPTSGRGRWRVDVRQPLMSNVPGVPRMLDPQLLVVQYTTKQTGHCMAIIHKRDYSNPTVLMQLYDVQKDQYWSKCDRHAKNIAVYCVNKVVVKE